MVSGIAAIQARFLPAGQCRAGSLFIQSGWTIYIYFSHLSSMPPFDQRAERDDLRARLANALPAATIASEDDKLEPTVPFDAIAAPEERAAFTALIESALARVASADNDNG
jgi:hypothetical protein